MNIIGSLLAFGLHENATGYNFSLVETIDSKDRDLSFTPRYQDQRVFMKIAVDA